MVIYRPKSSASQDQYLQDPELAEAIRTFQRTKKNTLEQVRAYRSFCRVGRKVQSKYYTKEVK